MLCILQKSWMCELQCIIASKRFAMVMHYQAYQWQHEHGWNASAGFPKRKGLTMTAGKITTRLWDIRGSHFEHRCLHKLVGHRHGCCPCVGHVCVDQSLLHAPIAARC